MTVSHLTTSQFDLADEILNELTGGSFSHLTMSQEEIYARIYNNLTGSSISHLTTSQATIRSGILTALASDDISFSPLTYGKAAELAAILNALEEDTAPSITSANSVNVAENAQLAFTVTTDETATVVIGGADAALFELASNPLATSRVLRWASNGTKDYEAPDDAGTNNVYNITLTPTDGASNVGSAQNFAATVTNVGEVPVNTVAPAITGTETEGETLTCSTGTWTGTPTSYAYQWFRAITSGGSIVTSGGLFTGVSIGGATAATHVLVAGDVGELLYCEVTATNAAGSAMKQSNATGAIVSNAWTPASLGAKLIGWYEANQGITESGGIVSQWNDLSGTVNHLSQATSGLRPTYSATALGGLPGIVVDGNAGVSHQGLVKSGFALGGSTFSAFLLGQRDSSGTARRMLAISDAGATVDYDSPNGCLIYLPNADDVSVYRSGSLSSKPLANNTPARIGSVFDGTNHTMYVNNVAGTPVAHSTAFSATTNLVLGAGLPGGPGDVLAAGTIGVISVAVFTNDTLTTQERSDLDDYLAAWTGA